MDEEPPKCSSGISVESEQSEKRSIRSLDPIIPNVTVRSNASLIEVMSVEKSDSSGGLMKAVLGQNRNQHQGNIFDYAINRDIENNHQVEIKMKQQTKQRAPHVCGCTFKCLGEYCDCFKYEDEQCENGFCCPTCVQAKAELLKPVTRGRGSAQFQLTSTEVFSNTQNKQKILYFVSVSRQTAQRSIAAALLRDKNVVQNVDANNAIIGPMNCLSIKNNAYKMRATYIKCPLKWFSNLLIFDFGHYLVFNHKDFYIINLLNQEIVNNESLYCVQIQMSSLKDKAVVKMFQNFFQLSTEPLYVQPQQPAPNLMESVHSHKIIPPKKKNTFPTLFNALSVVNQDGVIKINTGLYNENVEIRILGLKIQSNEPTSNAVMISEQRPTLIIDLPRKEDRVCIQGLKLAHVCEHSKNIIRWPNLKTIRDNRYRPYKVQENINTSILIKRGTLQIDQCRLSLAALKDARHLYASIIVQSQGSLIITRSQLVGNLGSVGIYCDGGKVNIRECSFRDHGGIGVWMNGGPNASLILKNSIITNCGQGLVLNGPFSSSVQNNVITECKSYGIITLFGNSSNLINNEIKQCKVGIEIENSCPKVMKNNLVDNLEYGMCSYSKMNEQCWPLIRFNLLAENKKGGLLVWGSRNNSEICNNVLQLNQKVGIKIESNSHPHIFLNEISATFGNGVHISGGATAFLQKNQIHGSVNSNLVLQGPRNIDNYIYSNHIHGARGNGLFLIHCQKFLVAKNNIHGNYNGVLCVTSVVNLEDNTISENKCNGVMLIQDCEIIMNENLIERNRVTGLVCRKTSKAKMKFNRFTGNRIDVVVENGWSGFNEIQKQNQFDEKADIRIPSHVGCQLI